MGTRVVDFPVIDAILKIIPIVMTITDAHFRQSADDAIVRHKSIPFIHIESGLQGALLCQTQLILDR
jgi:hypothetical protein